jgi:oligosaccharide repeat unit polymerase
MLPVSRPPRTAAASRRQSSWNATGARVYVAALGTVALVCATALFTGVAFDVETLAAIATALIAVIAVANLARLSAQIVAPSTLFLAALAVFHVGMIAPVAAGLDDAPAWLLALPEEVIAASLLAVILAFAAFGIGLVLGWKRTDTRPPSLTPIADAPRTPSALHGGGLVAALLAAGASLVNLSAIGFDRFFESSYGYEIYAATDSRMLQMSFFWMLPTAALISFAGARRGRESKRALALVGTTVALLLWAGDRGGAISLLAGTGVAWTATRGPVPRKIATFAALSVLVLVPTVATLRQLPRNALSISSIGEAIEEASPLSALTEMGASLRPLAETMQIVPSLEPYRYGRSYLAAVTRVAPNLGLSRADDDFSDADELAPDLWITYTVAPWTFAAYGGLGYSGVAEPYLNFGVLGIVGYFLALGFVLGRVDLRLAQVPSRRVLAVTAVVFMSFLLTVRNDIQNFVRPAIWDLALIGIIEVVYGVRTVRRVRRPRAPTRAAPARIAGRPLVRGAA